MNPNDTTSNAGSAEKPNPKLRRSCESCRSVKSRCIPSQEDETRCQRCAKDGKQCLFLSAKPRPKRSKSSRIRVAEMEQRLEDLMTLLSSRTTAEPLTNNPLPEETHVTPSEPEDIPQTFSPIRSQNQSAKFRTPWGNVPFPFFSPPVTVFDDYQDVISRGLVNLENAETSIHYFRTMATKFPFVVVPDHVSLGFLRRERPFLLLAILAIGAQYNLKLQGFLDEELRDSLCKRVIMKGERSMDILQGLLIYLTWYHHFFNPERQQLFQFSQLAVSMATDLGITKPSPRPSAENSLTVVLPSKIPKDDSGMMAESEQKRAFLGAYYLSSNLSLILRKTSNSTYRPYMEECSRSLAHNAEVETDKLIPHLVQLQRLNEEINAAFDLDGQKQLPTLDPLRIDILVKSFNEQLNVIQSKVPHDMWNNTTITSSYYHLRIYVNEVAFHVTRPSPIELEMPYSNNSSWYSANSRIEMLIRCLNAATTYLDHYLSVLSDDVRCFTTSEHMKILYAVLILGRFTTSVREDAPSLDAELIRTTANLDYYLGSIIEKLEGLFTIGTDGQIVKDFIHHLAFLFRHSRKWYTQLEGPGDGGMAVDCSELFCMDIVPILYCFKNSQAEKEDELWSDLMNVWPASAGDAFDIPMGAPLPPL